MAYSTVYQKSKYSSKTCEYKGSIYHSRKEAAYAQELDFRLKAKEFKKWERQIKIDLRLNGEHICNYYMDFVITHHDGSKEFVEVKGFATEVWRLKWKMTEAYFQKEIRQGKIKLTLVK